MWRTRLSPRVQACCCPSFPYGTLSPLRPTEAQPPGASWHLPTSPTLGLWQDHIPMVSFLHLPGTGGLPCFIKVRIPMGWAQNRTGGTGRFPCMTLVTHTAPSPSFPPSSNKVSSGHLASPSQGSQEIEGIIPGPPAASSLAGWELPWSFSHAKLPGGSRRQGSELLSPLGNTQGSCDPASKI